MIEYDSLKAVNLINGKSMDQSRYAYLVHEIKDLLEGDRMSCITHFWRSVNLTIHFMETLDI